MIPVTLSETGTAPFERLNLIQANSTTIADLFIDLPNAIIERIVLEVPNRFGTVIRSLHSNEFELKVAMPVTIELIDDDEAIATFPKGSIAISGDSPAHAVEELRHHLVGLYKIFKREEENLGRVPKAQLKILEAYIGKAR